MARLNLHLTVWGFCLLAGIANGQTIWYVDDDAALGGDGTSWETAFTYLQDALANTESGDEIHVAGGVYTPDRHETAMVASGRSSATFRLRSGVAVRGGYRGCPGGTCGGGDPDERHLPSYETVLSGDLNGNDAEVASPDDLLDEPTREDNSDQVVTGDNTDSTALLEGFIVTGGNGRCGAKGGGISIEYGSPTIRDCTIRGNSSDRGGGGAFDNAASSPSFIDCRFSDNAAVGFGGGMSSAGAPTLTRCTFVGNTARESAGGLETKGNATVVGCVFSRNSAMHRGGGAYDHASAMWTNCTMADNSASYGAGMSTSGSPSLANCAFLLNSAREEGGGLHSREDSSPVLTDCVFSGNTARSGGGMSNSRNSALLTNCTFSENSAIADGGGVYNDAGHVTLLNSILWGNRNIHGSKRAAQVFDTAEGLTAASYTCIQDSIAYDGDVFPGLGNIDAAPFFADVDGADGVAGTGDEDLRLLPHSPCIDAGDTAAVPGDIHDLDDDGDIDEPTPIDLLRAGRFFDDPCSVNTGNPDPSHPTLGIVDMGAIEFQEDLTGDLDGDGWESCDDNCPHQANPSQLDCDGDGVGDVCAIAVEGSHDCNSNGIPDECDIADGTSADADDNLVPDECQKTLYVDGDAALGGDGSSWATAFAFLQDALREAGKGDEIHVAEGIYTPDEDEAGIVTPGDREATFYLRNGIAVRGGYRGCPGGDCGGGDPDERDIALHETVLSGDLAGDDAEATSVEELQDDPTHAENSYVVVTSLRADETAVLDGITITSGNANNDRIHESGGGMYNCAGGPTLTSCTFRRNVGEHGGGMHNDGGNPTLTECAFFQNSAESGGGMYNGNEGNAALTHCTFSGNWANSSGGGISNWDSETTLTECAFSSNFAYDGGGIANSNCDPVLSGCVFLDNIACRGGAMQNYKSSPILKNCVVSANSVLGMDNCQLGKGGGVFNDDASDPFIVNCTFSGNKARYGGAVYSTDNSSPTLTNCTLSGNSSTSCAGAMYNRDNSNPLLANCSFSGNFAAASAGGVYNYGANPTLTNCVLWGNHDASGYGESAQIKNRLGSEAIVTFSCIQDETPGDGSIYPGVGNTDMAPFFVDADGPDGTPGTGDEDLNLLPRSPCIDAGDNSAVLPDLYDIDGDGDADEPTPFDVLGLPRFLDDPCASDVGSPDPAWLGLGIVDMGAIEYSGGVSGDPDGDGVTGCADNCPLHANPDQVDCDGDGLGDYCALELGASCDCNHNGIPDECDIADGTSADVDANGIPDECTTAYFVDDDAAPGGDGLSWETAFTHLQDALFLAESRDVIRIAGGLFRPDLDEAGHVTLGDREATFRLPSGADVRGGYRGCPGGDCSDGDPNERNITLYKTTLSGDLAGDDAEAVSPEDLLEEPTRSENSYHVVTANHTAPWTVLSGVTITGGNTAGAANGGGGLYAGYGSLALADCSLRMNTAHREGGGLLAWDNITLTNCTISHNSADGGGGGMQTIGDATLSECVLSDNWTFYYGGGLYTEYGESTLTNCTFTGNSADIGGGMCNEGDSVLTDCTFSGNSAERRFWYAGGSGGVSNHGSISLTNCTFSGNTAAGLAGAMGNCCNGNVNATLTNCTFTENTGVGVVHDDGNSTFIDCMFSRNPTTAIVSESGPTVLGCVFLENSQGILTKYSFSYLSDCVFVGNGRGMFSADTATLHNCTFLHNGSEGEVDGAGILFDYSDSSGHNGRPTLTNCTFSGNSTGANGGGIYSNECEYGPTLTNCTFLANSAGENGGGIYSHRSNPTLTNCTFSANSADGNGGSIYGDDHTNLTLQNSILWGNLPNEIIGDASGSITVVNSDVQDGWREPWFNEKCLDADPRFIAPGYWDDNGTPDEETDDFWVDGDYRLLADSPAIDAGHPPALPADALDLDDDGDTDEPLPIDLDGHARVLCGGVDMGAYEFGIGDFDCSRSVDLTDFASWEACMTGPGGGVNDPACVPFDFEYDGDVDLTDVAGFQTVLDTP